MNKDLRLIIKEFSETLSESDLEFLTFRMSQKLQGDLPEALNVLSKYKPLDSVLGSAKSSCEFFELVDKTIQYLQQECKKKGLIEKISA